MKKSLCLDYQIENGKERWFVLITLNDETYKTFYYSRALAIIAFNTASIKLYGAAYHL
jgi:hypothetical protein